MDKVKEDCQNKISVFDDISTISITGISKFNIEMGSTEKLTGDKYLIKNHTKNHYGEEEPLEDEEIIIKNK